MEPQTDLSESKLKRQQLFDSITTAFIWLFIGAGLCSLYMTYVMGPHGTKAYHVWSYDNMETTWGNTHWLGASVLKGPADLWMYQEVIYDTKPDILIEAGTYKGGSAYYFASIFDLMNHGRVVTIDIIDFPERPKHDRITFLLGLVHIRADSQVRPGSHQAGRAGDGGARLRSPQGACPERASPVQRLRHGGELPGRGGYQYQWTPRLPQLRPRAGEAVEEFLRENHHFVPDKSRERSGISYYPNGWLKRVP